MLSFYKQQLTVLNSRSSWGAEITEKRSEYLLRLFQNKLINRLKADRQHKARVSFYRETLLKLYSLNNSTV